MRSLIEQMHGGGEDKSSYVVGGALTSGGVLGAGLTLLVFKLFRSEYHPYVMPVIPTISSACAVAVRWTGSRIQRKFNSNVWERDRQVVIEFAAQGIAKIEEEMKISKAREAKTIFQAGINRFEKIKAMALSAAPCERPWMKELKEFTNWK